jgi:PAS domain S-box-containing protein
MSGDFDTETTTHREAVYRAFADRGLDPETATERALEVGAERLGVEVGFLTRIDDGIQTIVRSVGDHALIQAGETCPLDRAYCRRTVEVDGLLSVQNAAASEQVAETAYDTFELGAYIGSKVVVDGEVYGTLCFADEQPRDEVFSESDELFVELVARLAGQAVERAVHERTLHEQNERLRAEKQRFQNIAETSFDTLYRLDTEGSFTFVSLAVERILGYDPEALVGENFLSLVAEESVEPAVAVFEQLLDGETVERVELAFERDDGTAAILEVNAAPVYEDGELTAVQGVARDVTERREREAELRLKNRAVDDAQLGITIADATRPDNPLVYVNDGFERMTGYGSAAVLGQNCRFLQGEATDRETVEQLSGAVADERPVSVDILNYRADGTPFWNRLTITPIADEEGAVTHYLGFQDDITERKRTERLVALLNRVLRHNLRNDLNVLMGRGADHPTFEATIEDLLALSERARELESVARRQHDPRRLDPGDLLGGVAASHRERCPDATIDVAVATERDLCVGPEIERAVGELVGNALAHDTDPPTRVDIKAVDDGAFVAVTVADDGPGVPAMEASVIESGEETALEHGSGLGLWLVNWVVTRYGGSFQIHAPEEGGTVATVRLPALGPDDEMAAVARRPTVLFR